MKKCIAFFLSVLFLLFSSEAAYASSEVIRERETRAETGTGDTVSECQATFIITDETGKYPDETLVVSLTDISGIYSDSHETPIGKMTARTLTAPTAYRVSFPNLKDGFAVITTSGRGEDLTVSAPSQGNTLCEWSIVRIEDVPETEVEEADDPNAVFQKFLDAVSFIADDPEWEGFLMVYDNSMNVETYGNRYVSTVSGGTMEEWENMSTFDRFVWMETYVRFAYNMQYGNFDRYYGNHANFSQNVESFPIHYMENSLISDCSVVEEAYLELAEWQYDYVMANGYPYNLVEGRTYMEELSLMREIEEGESTTDEEGMTPMTDEEEEQQKEEKGNDDEEENEEEEDEEDAEGIWTSTMNTLSKDILLIVIIILLGLALFGVLKFRKERNED